MIDNVIAFITQTYGPVIGTSIQLILNTSFIWIPLILIGIFWNVWIQYIHRHFLYSQETVLLEIKLPREVTKTPYAMERVLTAMFQKGGPKHLFEAFWKGVVSPWFSLEIVSLGGNVHMFIWTEKKFRNLIEAQLYSQYPGIEVYETEYDYAKAVTSDPNEFEMWGGQFKLTESHAYPIQTYVDLGMDKPGQKEEEKDDPLSTILEIFGSIQKHEQIWMQILIEANKKENFLFGRLKTKSDWKEDVKKEIENVRSSIKVTSKDPNGNPITENKPLTEAEGQTIKAMQRTLDKFPFNTCIRAGYIAEKGYFDPSNISGLISTLRQVSSNNRNGFSVSWTTNFDYPWQDFLDTRKKGNERIFLDAYRRRSYFHEPYKHFKQQPYVLTTEELATLFHIPGTVASTPMLQRVMSQKAEAPTNLPSE